MPEDFPDARRRQAEEATLDGRARGYQDKPGSRRRRPTSPPRLRGVVDALKAKVLPIWHGRQGSDAVLQTALARATILVLNVATGILTSRALGPHGRGVLAAMLMWPQLLALVTTLGLPASLLYRLKSGAARNGSTLLAAFALSLCTGCFAAVAGSALMPFLLAGYEPAVVRFSRLLLLTTPVTAIAYVLQAHAEVSGDFRRANTLRLVPVIGVLAGIAVLMLLGTVTPELAALCYALPAVPVTTWLLVQCWRRTAPRLSGWTREARALLSYGLRCYPIDLIGTTVNYLGQLVVVTMLDPRMVGLFAISYSVSRIAEPIYSAVVTVMLPATAGQAKAEIAIKIARAARLNLIVTICLIAPLFLSAPLLLPFAYGADFAPAAPIAQLLLLEVMVTGTAWILAQAFLALGRPGVPVTLHAVSLALSIPLLVAVVPSFGPVGAAAGLLIVAVVKLAYILSRFVVILEAPLGCLFFRREDVVDLAQFLRRYLSVGSEFRRAPR
jgi:O-antigen/teichoic acid export membrane protein